MAVDVATTSKDVDVAKEKERAKAKTRANQRMVENRQKESRKEKLMPNNVEYATNMVIGHVNVQTESTKLASSTTESTTNAAATFSNLYHENNLA